MHGSPTPPPTLVSLQKRTARTLALFGDPNERTTHSAHVNSQQETNDYTLFAGFGLALLRKVCFTDRNLFAKVKWIEQGLHRL